MKKTLATLALVALAGAAQAVTVYEEGLSGDAGDRRNAATAVGTMTPTNPIEIAGQLDGIDDTRDWYSFTTTSSFQIDVTALALDTGNRSMRIRLRDSSGLVGSELIRGVSDDLFGTVSAGTYFLQLREGRDGLHTYGLSVAAVPVPASLPLLLAGFGGLAWVRRRKARLA